jgi:hypothetical protein
MQKSTVKFGGFDRMGPDGSGPMTTNSGSGIESILPAFWTGGSSEVFEMLAHQLGEKNGT